MYSRFCPQLAQGSTHSDLFCYYSPDFVFAPVHSPEKNGEREQRITYLRTFAPIATAHPYSARKFILVTRASDRPKALGNSMSENMRRGVLIAKNWLIEPYGACSLLVLTMNAPIRGAFDCSSRKPMRRYFVSGFPRALLSLSQEKSSGVEIDANSHATSCIKRAR